MLGHVPEKKDDLTVGFLKGKKTKEEMENGITPCMHRPRADCTKNN